MTGTASKDIISAMKIQEISQTPIYKGDLRDLYSKKSAQETDLQTFRLQNSDFPENRN